MKLENLSITKTQFVIVDSNTEELFQEGRMFDRTCDAKNAYYQDRWFSTKHKLSRRFDDQNRMKIVTIEYQRTVTEIK